MLRKLLSWVLGRLGSFSILQDSVWPVVTDSFSGLILVLFEAVYLFA